ncbi:MAG TPA: hypothetical protein DD458_15205 [Prolixibacteraceae bacterium]|nr:hypothetical protein [Marinilabiliales bacterium]HBL76570.1 hypothetical protein [Prolixibacteraceae bacterium]HCU63173.1 hypothetical protein [Prolixibacteraceae bacterium]
MKQEQMKVKKQAYLILLSVLFLKGIAFGACMGSDRELPIRAALELNIGESQEVKLTNGEIVRIKLLEITDKRDTYRNAIRGSEIKISVDDEMVTLNSGNYNLPVTVGKVQIDCPVIKNYYSNTNQDRWGLSKDARFRLWPKGSPYMKPGTFVYPIKQEWLASLSQAGNEPTYADWGESRESSIYYHSGFDIGGAEGMDEIVSATDGLVISSNNLTLDGYTDFPGDVRPDVVYIKDSRGWVFRYSHLDSVLPEIQPGVNVKAGQKIGYIGKQGQSGGWVHLHFEIKHKETSSGEWGTEDPYIYAWEAYNRQYRPSLMAVARPHQIAWVGEPVALNGSKSRSFEGDITSFEWQFSDGTAAMGPVQKKIYDRPGEYSEILKVTDSKGNVDYDFMVVQVFGPENSEHSIPAIHAAFHPTLDIEPGEPVTFLARTFNGGAGNEIWDFGDGSPTVETQSEPVNRKASSKGEFAKTIHSFSKAGHYIVRVKRENEYGYTATGLLHVVVDK